MPNADVTTSRVITSWTFIVHLLGYLDPVVQWCPAPSAQHPQWCARPLRGTTWVYLYRRRSGKLCICESRIE